MKTILALVIIGLALCAWAPWVKEEDARVAMERQYDASYREGKPLFSGACTLISLDNLHRGLFGYKATAHYNCEISGEGTTDMSYTFTGNVLGAPAQ